MRAFPPSPPAATRPFEWIEDPQGLARVVDRLAAEPAIGVDLEADSLFHFQEKVCLLQVATPERVFLIDPISLHDLSALSPVFASPGVTKVLHGSDYDLRSLDRDFAIQVRGLFDTQIAARFLGLEETGLANLLESRFGVLAEKKFQKKDWSVRPLPDDMLRYGAEDAAYLIPLFQMLREELRTLGRLSWVEEECAILSGVRHAPPDDGPLFLRLRGAGSLERRGLAAAEALLRFRLELARKRDRPPFKILGNQPTVEMARTLPVDVSGLSTVPGLSKGQVRAMGNGLVQCIQKALDLPTDDLPVYPRRRSRRPKPGVLQRIRALKAWREKRAAELKLNPSVLFTNAQIQAVSEAKPKQPRDLGSIEGIRKWQLRAFGEEICAVTSRAG